LIQHGADLRITPCLGHIGPGNPDSLLPIWSPHELDESKTTVGARSGLTLLDEMLGPPHWHIRSGTHTRLGTQREGSSVVVHGVERSHHGKDPDTEKTTIEIDYSNFLCCIDLGLVNMVSWLIPFFAPRRDVNDWTPLHHAAISGNAFLVDAMLTQHGRPEPSEGNLVTRGANPNITTAIGFTPLHLAVGPAAPLSEQQAVISALLPHGAHINAPDEREYTPLHIASENHNLQAIRTLLVFDLGATNANYIALNRRTPLDLALRDHGSSLETAEPVARMLVQAGADVNHAAGGGRTALHHAVRARNTRLVELLLEFGADCRIQDGVRPMVMLPFEEYLPVSSCRSGSAIVSNVSQAASFVGLPAELVWNVHCLWPYLHRLWQYLRPTRGKLSTTLPESCAELRQHVDGDPEVGHSYHEVISVGARTNSAGASLFSIDGDRDGASQGAWGKG